MTQRKKIEVFSAGCQTCREAVETVRRVAGSDHDIEVLDMHQDDVAARAKRLGIASGGRSSCRLLRRPWSR